MRAPSSGSRRRAGETADSIRELLSRPDPSRARVPTSHEVQFDADAKAALERAAIEADDAGNSDIRPEHLLLGVMVRSSGQTSRALQALGVDLSAVREFLKRPPPA
jgi:ATP-dependent Clp protease ATP-binding subunit ClpA